MTLGHGEAAVCLLPPLPPFSRMLVPGSSRPGAAPECSACHPVLGVSVAAVTIRPHGSLRLCICGPPTPLPSAPWSPEKRHLGGGVRAQVSAKSRQGRVSFGWCTDYAHDQCPPLPHSVPSFSPRASIFPRISRCQWPEQSPLGWADADCVVTVLGPPDAGGQVRSKWGPQRRPGTWRLPHLPLQRISQRCRRGLPSTAVPVLPSGLAHLQTWGPQDECGCFPHH